MSPFRWKAMMLSAVAVMTVAGCGGGGSSSAQSPVVAPSAGQNAGATSPAAGGASTAPSASPGATAGAGQSGSTGGGAGDSGNAHGTGAKNAPPLPAAARCKAKALQAQLAGYTTGGAQRSVTLVLANTSKKSCKLRGWPSMRLATVDKPFDTTVVRQGKASTVTLAAGGKAHTVLKWSAAAAQGESGSQCEPPAGYLQIFPPDEKEWLIAQWNGGPVCAHNRLEVSAIAGGASA